MFLLDPRQIGRKTADPHALGDTVSPPAAGRLFKTGVPEAYGRHMDGTTGSPGTKITSPVQIGSDTNWTKIGSSQWITHGIKGGELWGSGYHQYGSVGNNTTATAYGGQHYSSMVQLGALTTWTQVGHCRLAGFALKSDGTFWGWGQSNYGASGISGHKSSPVQGSHAGWTNITGSTDSGIGLAGGGLYTWGSNGYGQCGNGNTTNVSPNAVQVGSYTDYTACHTGYQHAAAIRNSGELWSWGDNTYGELGTNDTTSVSSPVQTPGASNWRDVTTNNIVTIAINTAGELWSWGFGSALLGLVGSSGYGGSGHISSPIQIGAETYWESIGVCGGSAVARRTDGKVYVWGANANGQMGLGDTTERNSPVMLGGLEGGAATTHMSQLENDKAGQTSTGGFYIY